MVRYWRLRLPDELTRRDEGMPVRAAVSAIAAITCGYRADPLRITCTYSVLGTGEAQATSGTPVGWWATQYDLVCTEPGYIGHMAPASACWLLMVQTPNGVPEPRGFRIYHPPWSAARRHCCCRRPCQNC